MVPELPSLTRRRLLAGLGGAVGGGTVAVGATEPTALPDVLTDQATRYYPTPPEVRELWRPTVTEAHAEAAVERLAESVERGERLWQKIDTDRPFGGAGGHLEDAREDLADGHYHDALWSAETGMQFAPEYVGVARRKLGRTDFDALVERTTQLLDGIDERVAAVQPYPVSDPGRDLAWYYRIDRELQQALWAGTWRGYEELRDSVESDGDGGSGDSDDSSVSRYDARGVGQIRAGLLRAEQSLENVRRFREALGDLLGSDASPAQQHIRETNSSLLSAVESFPTRSEVEDEFLDEDEYRSDDPYIEARLRLAHWCFDTDYRIGLDEEIPLPVYNLVNLSTALAQRRAHEFAVENLAVSEGQTGFDSGHTLAEKRRARRTYRRVVGADPPPLLTRMARRAIEDLQVAKVGFVEYEYPLWRDRLKAYLYALVGRAKLRVYPDVYDTVVGDV